MKPLILRNEVEPVIALRSANSQRGGQPRLLLQLEPGALFSARVQARLEDGSFKVEMAGQFLRMALPGRILPGDTIELAFVTDKPRLTFTLQRTESAADAATRISSTGRQIAALMTQVSGSGRAAPTAVTATLLAGAPIDAAGLAATLQKSLTQSGLFYEAHQAQWVTGKRSLEQLRLEPQSKLQPGSQATLEPALSAGAATGSLPAAAAQAEPAEPALRAGSLPLVQQQLGALETGRIMLSLEVWPQQAMQWEVEQEQEGRAGDGAEPSGWRTRLRLQLPLLGELNADLTLGVAGLQIRMDTGKAETADLLQQHRLSLRHSLQAAGIASATITIARRSDEPS